jgi:RHS repeat-associated protein
VTCISFVKKERWLPYRQVTDWQKSWQGTLVEDKVGTIGLMYRRNRYYDPGTGRFTQEDPTGVAGGLNLYGFASGDPVSYRDPFGLCPDDQFKRRGVLGFLGIGGKSCPGGLDKQQYNETESAILSLDSGLRESLLQMLQGGRIQLTGRIRNSEPAGSPSGRILVTREFFDNSRAGYQTTGQRAWILGHEYGHQVQRTEGKLLYLPMEASIGAYFVSRPPNPLFDVWQDDANIYACKYSTTVERGAWQTLCSRLGVP